MKMALKLNTMARDCGMRSRVSNPRADVCKIIGGYGHFVYKISTLAGWPAETMAVRIRCPMNRAGSVYCRASSNGNKQNALETV